MFVKIDVAFSKNVDSKMSVVCIHIVVVVSWTQIQDGSYWNAVVKIYKKTCINANRRTKLF